MSGELTTQALLETYRRRKTERTGVLCEEPCYGQAIYELYQWIRAQAAHCQEPEQAVLDQVLDGFFADPYCEEHGYPFPLLARKRSELYFAARKTRAAPVRQAPCPKKLVDPMSAAELGRAWQQLDALLLSEAGKERLRTCYSWDDWLLIASSQEEGDHDDTDVPF